MMTLLGLLFDRVHFPNVRVPLTGFDPDWVAKEIQRIEQAGLRDYDTWLLLQLMRYAINPEVQQFFYFTADENQVFGGDAMKKAGPLVQVLYNQLYPPQANFIPTFTPGHHKGLPYDATIDYPGPFFYQANAILYAGEHGIPLLNDDPRLPVPALAGMDAKHNAAVLATIMAMECAQLVLPEVPELQPAQIVEVREELKAYVRPFRMSLLELAGKLNAAIEATTDYAEIKRAAEFLVATEVYPKLEEFKNELRKHEQRGWWPRVTELGKQAIGLGMLYSSGRFPEAIAGSVKAFGGWLIAGATENAPHSGLHYLLKLQEHVSPKK